MNHFLASDNRHRDLICDAPGDYRFGRTRFGRTPVKHARAAFNRVSSYLKTTIEVIANSKLRRMERELELRGIRGGRSNGRPVALKSRPMKRSRGLK
jgi:hypothetical protein